MGQDYQRIYRERAEEYDRLVQAEDCDGALEVARDILLAIAGRQGPVPDGIRARVAACDDLARPRALTLELADDVDEPAVEALLAALAAAG